MGERAEQACVRHRSGYNCAQAVACAFAEDAGVDEAVVFRMTEGMGFGMGCMEGTCGALAGACAVAGLMCSDANLGAPRSKRATYKVSAHMLELFRERVGALQCREIKGVGTGEVLMPCPECVRIGAEIVEEVLFERD